MLGERYCLALSSYNSFTYGIEDIELGFRLGSLC